MLKKYFLYLVFIICTNTPIWAQFPPADPYPYLPPATVISQAQQISDSLEAYILKWTQGLVSDSIPDSLIPQGISDSKDFYLKDPTFVTPEETWAVRYAKPINKDSLYGGIPDPKFTYLFLGTAFAPFGSKLVVEGEFPHARFFSLQISPPLDGTEYYSQRQFGSAEVAIADVDIEPLPGHVNPFRLGANRNATNRSYRIEFDLTTGNPVALNPNAHSYPYRAQSNNRKGALLSFQGPLGHKTLVGTPIPDPGDWNLGCLWLRIYCPDPNTDALGGVPMPKVYFELPNGERYFIGSNFSKLQARADATTPNLVSVTQPVATYGPATGWGKSYGITRSILNGIASVNGWYNQKEAIRNLDFGWTGRREDLPAPASIEPHATTNNYISYVGRAVTVPPGKVAVLTGRMPTFPQTENGEPTMQGGEVRYWSIIGVDQDPFSPAPSSTVHAIADADVVLDNNRNYVIAYSRESERPANATAANGVSWVDWGTQSYLGVLMRWTCVAPEWYFPLAPHENNIPFAVGDWSSATYDSTLLGVNWRNGFMKCFLPTVHYMDVAEFEALGNNLNAEKIPVWVDSVFTNGAADSRLGTATASGVLDTAAVNKPQNVNDGNVNTAWSGPWNTPNANITIDLGSVKKVSAIKLHWDWVLFAKDYEIVTSTDNVNWTTLTTVTNENGQIDLFKNLQNVSARYVRLNLTAFNVLYYRLGEFEVFTTDCKCESGVTAVNPAQAPTLNFTVYPNPVNTNTLFVELSGNKSYTAQVLNTQGQTIATTTLANGVTTVDLANLAPGVYYITVQSPTARGVKKFIKL